MERLVVVGEFLAMVTTEAVAVPLAKDDCSILESMQAEANYNHHVIEVRS